MVAAKRREVKRQETQKGIKKALIDRGWSVTELARRAGYRRDYVSLVIHGRLHRPQVQRCVARALGMRAEEVFPGRELTAHGLRLTARKDGRARTGTDGKRGKR